MSSMYTVQEVVDLESLLAPAPYLVPIPRLREGRGQGIQG